MPAKANPDRSTDRAPAIPDDRDRIAWWAKLTVTSLCVFVTWRHLGASLPAAATFSLHPWQLALAVMLRPVFTFTLALRTHCLTSVTIKGLPLLTVLRATFIGQMANLALPGGAGGDIARGTIFWRASNPSWSRVIGVLVLDRLLGMISLLGLAALFSLPVLSLIVGGRTLSIAATIIVTLVGALWLGRKRARILLTKSDFLENLASAWREISSRVLLKATALAVAGHLILIASISLIFPSAGIHINWQERIGITTLALLLGNLPLTLGGHGIREGTFVFLLCSPAAGGNRGYSVTFDSAFAFAAISWVVHVLTNLIGGIVGLYSKNLGIRREELKA